MHWSLGAGPGPAVGASGTGCVVGQRGMCVGYTAPSSQCEELHSALCVCHAHTWPCTPAGVCAVPSTPRGPMRGLGLTGVSQGTVAQLICGALRLLLHHAGVELEGQEPE